LGMGEARRLGDRAGDFSRESQTLKKWHAWRGREHLHKGRTRGAYFLVDISNSKAKPRRGDFVLRGD